MAKRNDREYLHGDTVRLKKYFYVLRPLLACRWILEKKSPPPILFSELAAASLPSAIRPEVDALVRRKADTPELGEGKPIPAIDRYMGASFSELETLLQAYPDAEAPAWDALNRLFRSSLLRDDGL